MNRFFNKRDWPAWGLLIGFICLFTFISTASVIDPGLVWILYVPLVLGLVSLTAGSAALFVRLYKVAIRGVKSAKTSVSKNLRLVALVIGSLIGIPAIIYYWFLPIALSYGFFNMAIQVRQGHP